MSTETHPPTVAAEAAEPDRLIAAGHIARAIGDALSWITEADVMKATHADLGRLYPFLRLTDAFAGDIQIRQADGVEIADAEAIYDVPDRGVDTLVALVHHGWLRADESGLYSLTAKARKALEDHRRRRQGELPIDDPDDDAEPAAIIPDLTSIVDRVHRSAACRAVPFADVLEATAPRTDAEFATVIEADGEAATNWTRGLTFARYAAAIDLGRFPAARAAAVQAVAKSRAAVDNAGLSETMAETEAAEYEQARRASAAVARTLPAFVIVDLDGNPCRAESNAADVAEIAFNEEDASRILQSELECDRDRPLIVRRAELRIFGDAGPRRPSVTLDAFVQIDDNGQVSTEFAWAGMGHGFVVATDTDSAEAVRRECGENMVRAKITVEFAPAADGDGDDE